MACSPYVWSIRKAYAPVVRTEKWWMPNMPFDTNNIQQLMYSDARAQAPSTNGSWHRQVQFGVGLALSLILWVLDAFTSDIHEKEGFSGRRNKTWGSDLTPTLE
jgi:hypothetical protein